MLLNTFYATARIQLKGSCNFWVIFHAISQHVYLSYAGISEEQLTLFMDLLTRQPYTIRSLIRKIAPPGANLVSQKFAGGEKFSFFSFPRTISKLWFRYYVSLLKKMRKVDPIWDVFRVYEFVTRKFLVMFTTSMINFSFFHP